MQRSRLSLPVNGQRIPRRNGFPITVMTLPETSERLRMYDNARISLDQFQPQHMIHFIVNPRSQARDLDPVDIFWRIRRQLEAYLGLSLANIPGQLSVSLDSAVDGDINNQPERLLGGDSNINFRFDSIDDVDISNVFAIYEERNYVGIVVEMMRWDLSFSLYHLLSRESRGGCTNFVYHDMETNKERAIPLRDFGDGVEYRLHQYADWPPLIKQKFGKRYKDEMPKSLKDLRGLYCYSIRRDIEPVACSFPDLVGKPLYPVCALMAFLYGWHLAKFRSGEIDVSDALLNDTGCLYYTAVQYVEKYRTDSRGLFSNRGFVKLVNEICPEFAVTVFDATRTVMFRAEGASYVSPLPNYGFRRGEFTEDVLKRYWQRRICIFLDTEKQHYVPIFDTDLFFSSTSARHVMMYCPFCQSRVHKKMLPLHRCRIIECLGCSQKFENKELLEAHRSTRDMDEQECEHCWQIFRNTRCFRRHFPMCKGTYSIVCIHCKKKYKSNERHECLAKRKCTKNGNRGCPGSNTEHRKLYDENGIPYDAYHLCPFRRQELKPRPMADTWVFDFECLLEKGVYNCLSSFRPSLNAVSQRNCTDVWTELQDMELPNDLIVHRHRVNYAYAMPLILEGRYLSEEEALERAISGNTIAEFWEKMKSVRSEGISNWYAHNLKGYDGRLLMDFFEKHDIAPESIMKAGDKIMGMEIRVRHVDAERYHGLRFFDSLLLLNSGLKNLPKMFGLDTNIVRKGDFPYLFNTPENQQYDGPLPATEFYEIDRKSPGEKERFLEWYKQESLRLIREGTTWNLQKELRAYCINDVVILAKALRIFSETMCQMNNGANPLWLYTTASYAWSVYRHLHLPDDLIYRLNINHDKFARRALHGGKTDVRIMQVELAPETIAAGTGLRYVDVQSLYPTVQYYDLLPVGPPETTLYTSANPLTMEEHYRLITMPEEHGLFFIECDLEPKRYVHHPIVGDYVQNRFMAHVLPIKRAVLTSIEYKAALNEGYVATAIYRIDRYCASRDAFKSYIRTFLRLKILSSKKPFSADASEEEKEAYFSKVREKYGFDIKESEFEENPAIRALAKLLLNSLWGKFGQRNDLVQTEFCRDGLSLRKYADSIRHRKIRELGTRQYGKTAWQKVYKKTNIEPKYNIAIASFVTAHARLRLLKELKRMGDRVVYHDTDSIVYLRQPGKPDIEEGQFLGDWESETGTNLIDQFIGLAPKTYAYSYVCSQTGERKNFVKVKGFPLDGRTSQKLTLDHFREVLYKTLVPGERPFALNELLAATRQRVQNDVDADGQVVIQTNVFAHAYPSEKNINQFIANIDERYNLQPKNLNTLMNRQYLPFMYTAQQNKVLKLDYQKGVINTVNQTQRYGLDSTRNCIRFETLPYGWERFPEAHLDRDVLIHNSENAERVCQNRPVTCLEGYELREMENERIATAEAIAY